MSVPTIGRSVRVHPVMGTVVSVDVRGQRSAAADTVDRALAWLDEVDATYSTYRPDSPISRIARGELAVEEAGDEVRWVLSRCTALERETGGFFSAHALGTLDPSGFVKGWAVQRAAELLADGGLRNFCISAGGDIACRGAALPGAEWRIGIQHPLDASALAAVVVGTDLAVATSGAYARGEHVRDPHTGRSPQGALSVTVVGPDLGLADAYATAAFAMGEAGAAWTARLPGYEAMTILADRTVRSTFEFPFAGDAR